MASCTGIRTGDCRRAGCSRSEAPPRKRVHRVERKPEKGKKGSAEKVRGKVKFAVYGEEMLEKKVSLSGNSGRIYLPPDWVGRQVKIVRIN
jgi:putative transposon-encoded protein